MILLSAVTMKILLSPLFYSFLFPVGHCPLPFSSCNLPHFLIPPSHPLDAYQLSISFPERAFPPFRPISRILITSAIYFYNNFSNLNFRRYFSPLSTRFRRTDISNVEMYTCNACSNIDRNLRILRIKTEKLLEIGRKLQLYGNTRIAFVIRLDGIKRTCSILRNKSVKPCGRVIKRFSAITILF